MNLKKLVSGIASLTIAASAFAGLTVTASAATAGDYTSTVSPTAQNRITNNGDGTFTTASNAGNQYALAIADLSTLIDIDSASTVTVEFDTVNAGRFIVGVGDKSTRGTNAGNSSKSTYNTEGLIMRFGTTDGTYYRVNGGTNNSSAMNATVHAKITLNRTAQTYSYTLTTDDGEITLFSGSDVSTSVSNLTIIEAYTWLGSATFTFSDVSVSYTIPDVEPVTYTLNAVDGNGTVLKEGIGSVKANPGLAESITGLPYIIQDDNGTYYKLNDSTVSNYSKSVTMGDTDKTGTVTYAEATDCVYYSEVESNSNTGGDTYPTSSIGTFSMGKGSAVMKTDYELSYSFTVAAGAYCTITVPYNNTNVKARGFKVQVDNADISDTISVDSGASGTYTSNSIELAAGTHTVELYCTYSLTPVFDYVLVTKTGDAPSYTGLAAVDTGMTDDTTGDNYYAKAFKFTANPNDGTISGVTVTVGGVSEKLETTVASGAGDISFGIIVASEESAKISGLTADDIAITLN